jgi:hypothetical protein
MGDIPQGCRWLFKTKHKAYVCLKHKIVEGFPYFSYASIYSESARNLTTCGGELYTDVFEVEGDSFQNALDNAMGVLRCSSHYSWILKHLK